MKVLKIFVKFYQLGYCAAMIHFWIFPNCNPDTDDYDVIDPENSAKGIAPRPLNEAAKCPVLFN